MGEIVNLRRARKTKERQSEETKAAANRAHHGTPTKVRKSAKAEQARVRHVIEAHKLDEPENNSNDLDC
jgi:hypothetical protein